MLFKSNIIFIIQKISAIGFSHDSRFLVIGNEEGELRTFRL